ncbi:MAG TPA: M23 family metallopeptidase [Thermoanaerobaculia bacterium]|jgi:murein DD-endopeptidase MepM/ murein hydrolase activator NlpD
MQTLKMLAAGWLIGAGVLIALSVDPGGRALRASSVPLPAAAESGPERRRMPELRPAGGILIPVQGISADQLRDSFSEVRGGGSRIHRAMDILAPQGTPVFAAVDGTVKKLFNSRAGGITLYQYDVAEETIYYYAHLDRYANGMAEGLFVKQGAVIGYVGVTGNAGTTPHLHFSIERLPPTKEWWKGEPVNPYPILRAAR